LRQAASVRATKAPLPPIAVVAALLSLVSCGHYGDFQLPQLESSTPAPLHLALDPKPVLTYSPSGEWDSSDVLNPSIIEHEKQLWNYYSGFDGKVWHTGLATSPDGTSWTRRGKVLSPDPDGWDRGYIAANGSALWRGGEFLYWYQAGEHDGVMRIGLARSWDGMRFRKEPKPALDVGPYQSWDERGVADPYVIETGGWLYMYYLGQDRAARQRIGLARSRDGVSWEKLRSNPIVEISDPGSRGMDEHGAGEPAVFIWKGHYWMLITGRDAGEHRRLAVLWSADGVHWTRQEGAISGDQPWDRVVVCDPTVIAEDSGVRVWFGGGDVASPDERLHGQIGIGRIAN
jgi:predicted GH43/DUF377 family glycosyl hydrolase